MLGVGFCYLGQDDLLDRDATGASLRDKVSGWRNVVLMGFTWLAYAAGVALCKPVNSFVIPGCCEESVGPLRTTSG
jgi:hypothetical protein